MIGKKIAVKKLKSSKKLFHTISLHKTKRLF
jgi:hypothetical protein